MRGEAGGNLQDSSPRDELGCSFHDSLRDVGLGSSSGATYGAGSQLRLRPRPMGQNGASPYRPRCLYGICTTGAQLLTFEWARAQPAMAARGPLRPPEQHVPYPCTKLQVP